MPFAFTPLSIKDVILIEPKVFGDERGYFVETYKLSDFNRFGINSNFVQINQSYSLKNVLRGLHYQLPPYAQAKLVSCISGEIFDVAVDIRKGSPTFGKWIGEFLSGNNKKMLYIPEGFAHGFLVISDTALIQYLITGGEYAPSHERGIIWNDKQININWPVKDVSSLLLSEKDKKNPCLKEADIIDLY